MKIKLLLLFLILPVFIFAQDTERYALFDSKGEQITEYNFDFISPFSENISLVIKDNKIGYINNKGDKIIDYSYDFGTYFQSGVALIKKDNNYYYINSKGQLLFNSNYFAFKENTDNVIETNAEINHKNFLPVMHNNKVGIYDIKGNMIIPCEYDNILSDGKVYLVKKDNKFGYLNSELKMFLPLVFDRGSLFFNGFAIVTKGNKTYVINSSGQTIAKDCDEYYILSKDVILASKNNKIGAFDKTGKIIIPFEWTLDKGMGSKYISRELMKKNNNCFILYKEPYYCLFSPEGIQMKILKDYEINEYENELTLISKGEYVVDVFGHIGFKTKREAMNYVDSLKIKSIMEMPNKYSLIKQNSSFKILDKNWNIILEPNYSDIKNLNENSFSAFNGNKWGIVDLENKNITPFEYDYIGEFINDFAIVKKERFGVINKEGKEIIPCSYNEVNILPSVDNTYFAIKK